MFYFSFNFILIFQFFFNFIKHSFQEIESFSKQNKINPNSNFTFYINFNLE